MKIGVMQGRLSRQSRYKIQSFPWKNWHKEFKILNQNNFRYLEWTIDFYNFYKNNIFTKYKKILYLKKKYKIKINSITCDCFMEKPFWRKKNEKYETYFQNLVKAAKQIGIKYIIIPLVDNGSIRNSQEEKRLFFLLKKNLLHIKKNKVQILFEVDFNPPKVLKFIKKLDQIFFGINYDTGNSASLGYDLVQEFSMYGKYIKNIHLKDRILNGSSVRLGKGDANFKIFFQQITKIKYKGVLIFQTARAKKFKKDLEEILKNRSYIKKFL